MAMLLILSVQLSPVQQLIKDSLTTSISKRTKMKVEVQRVKIALPFYFHLSGVTIHDHHNNLMLSANSVSATIKSYGIRSGVMRVGKLSLIHPFINHKLYLNEDRDNLSLFISRIGSDTVEGETSEGSPIRVERIVLDKGRYLSSLDHRPSVGRSINPSHLNLRDLYVDVSNIYLKGSDISFKINRLKVKEKDGFFVKNLTAQAEIGESSIRVRNLTAETSHSALALDLSFHFRDFSDFNDFENKVRIVGEFGVSRLSTYDLGYWVPQLYKTSNMFNLKGGISGVLSDFTTKDFQFSSGFTSFDGKITMKGLPDFQNTYIDLNINHLVVDPFDISKFIINNNGRIERIKIPQQVLALGPASVEGEFSGYYTDFLAKADFTGGFGFISTELRLSEQNEKHYAKGGLEVHGVDVGLIAPGVGLGMVSFNLDVNGSATKNKWNFVLNGLVSSLEFNKYDYRNIDVNGTVTNRQFIGNIGVEDQNIALEFDGNIDFNQQVPVFNFEADIKKANLARLGLVSDSLKGILSAKVAINMQGDHPDNIAGVASVEHAELNTPAKNYKLNSLTINAVASPENKKKLIVVRSDYLDGDITGNFNYATLPDALHLFMQPYLPKLMNEVYKPQNGELAAKENNDVYLDIKIKQLGNLTQLLTGNRVEGSPVDLKGSFRQEQNLLKLNINAGEVTIGGKQISELYLNIFNSSNGIVSEIGAKEINITDSIIAFHPYFEGHTINNTTKSSISWNLTPEKVELEGLIQSELTIKGATNFEILFNDGYISISDTLWKIRQGSSVTLNEKSLDINRFEFFSNSQKIVVDGNSAEYSDHSITATFDKIDLSWIDFLTVPAGIDLDGAVSGEINVKNMFDDIRVLADISIDEFAMNGDKLGTVYLKSLWDDVLQGMNVIGSFMYQGNIGVKQTAGIRGYIYPMNKDGDNFDLTFDFDNFRLNLLSSILSSITTDIRGFGMGTLHLGGTFNAPAVTGKLKATVRNIYFDYLNTWYSFTDTITFTNNAIIFNNISLSDNNRPNVRDPYEGVLNGYIEHKGFSDFYFNLSIKANNFTFMNTNGEQDPYYYGRAMASGNVSFTGPENNMLIKVQATTNKHTSLEIPVTSASEVSRSSFINFISERPDGNEYHPSVPKKNRESVLRMDMTIRVTPDATVRLIFDPLIGDMIEANGSGDLQMDIDSKGDFDLRGQYVISKGDYMFNLENIISKKFSIKNNSSIRWNGSPYDALLDIEAIYPTKAHLSALNPEDSALSAQPVNCVIYMGDKLSNPDIKFGIEFPDMASFDEEKYQALVKPNLNYHFLSLLAISRFINNESQQFIEAGSSANLANVSATEILANQLSLWISNISDEFDVDFAYHPGSYLGEEQVEAAFKTQVLNDRLLIQSKVGISGRNSAGADERTGSMVGDLEAEYKIDKDGKFRVKAYNKYNGYNVLYEGAPYTQGLGVFYRREFNRIGEAIKEKKKVRDGVSMN